MTQNELVGALDHSFYEDLKLIICVFAFPAQWSGCGHRPAPCAQPHTWRGGGGGGQAEPTVSRTDQGTELYFLTSICGGFTSSSVKSQQWKKLLPAVLTDWLIWLKTTFLLRAHVALVCFYCCREHTTQVQFSETTSSLSWSTEARTARLMQIKVFIELSQTNTDQCCK